MGLDIWAFARMAPVGLYWRGYGAHDKKVYKEAFEWRSHDALQEVLMPQFARYYGMEEIDLTCKNCEVFLPMIEDLESRLNNGGLLPDFNDLVRKYEKLDWHVPQRHIYDSYVEQDKAFCKWAREQIARGRHVYIVMSW